MKKVVLGIAVGILLSLLAHGIHNHIKHKQWMEGWGQYYSTEDPNKWDYSEPANPILLVDYDYMRLLEGSSIKHIDIGDPNVTVAWIEPRQGNTGIEIADPNAYGWIIKNCIFYMEGTY